jgi:hypothetical protein
MYIDRALNSLLKLIFKKGPLLARTGTGWLMPVILSLLDAKIRRIMI